jgi:hypothetical protein
MKRSVKFVILLALASVAVLAGCGGGSGSNSTTSTSGSGGNSGGGSTAVNNSAPLVVDAGPPAAVSAGLVADNDIAFTTITVCVPGTSSCQNIDHVQVDTGSEGLRLPTGLLTVSLPQQSTFECLGFADGTFVWGPLATADIQIAGEVAHSVPVQLASSSLPPASANNSGCTTTNTGALSSNQIFTVPQFGSNGIVGVGVFRQDCGQGCLSATNSIYFNCATAACNPITQSLATQVQNPVWMFASDNNGVILELPSISANGQATATGSLIFGIGTQSDNGIGSATPIIPDLGTGNFAAKFQGVLFNDVNANGPGGTGGAGFIDSGSNGLFFLDSATLSNPPPFSASNPNSGFGINMPDCPTSGPNALQGFYCPGGLTTIPGGSGGLTIFSESSQDIPVGSGKNVTLNINNGVSLVFTSNSAFDDLGGPNPNTFDLGLPFFFGQNVYFGIEGQSIPLFGSGVTGPLYAF